MQIYVKKEVKSEIFPNQFVVRKGIHEAFINKNGAISCKTTGGQLLGIKLDEFEFLSEADRGKWILIAYPEIPSLRK